MSAEEPLSQESQVRQGLSQFPAKDSCFVSTCCSSPLMQPASSFQQDSASREISGWLHQSHWICRIFKLTFGVAVAPNTDPKDSICDNTLASTFLAVYVTVVAAIADASQLLPISPHTPEQSHLLDQSIGVNGSSGACHLGSKP